MFVFQLAYIAGAQKCVDHEAQQPIHFQRHAAVHGLDVKACIGLVPHIHMASQHLGLAKYGGVLGDGECATRLLRDLHFGKQRHLRNHVLFHQITQHFAQLRDVTHDGGRRQFFVR